MHAASKYFDFLNSKLQEVVEQELPNIEKAAQLVTESCLKGGRLYVFGSGQIIFYTSGNSGNFQR